MWEFFEAGGPVMWPLLLCSVVVLAVTLERLWYWSRLNLDKDQSDIETLLQGVEQGKSHSGEVDKKASWIFYMLAVGAGYTGEAGIKAMQAVSINLLKNMRRGMGVLDTMITISPMLGILGTVLGIIESFDMLGGAGVDDPKAVVSGIASALITTATGLSISVAAVFPYNYFNARIDEAQDKLEVYSTRLEILQGHCTADEANAEV